MTNGSWTFVCCSKNCRASVSMGSVHRDNASCLESLEGFLQHVLQAPIMEGLLSIREQANEISKNSTGVVLQDVDVMRQLLKEVKNWTQVLLDEECRRILQVIPYLQKLLTALFVMKVKVLSVINMRKDTSEFPLTIPSNATFVHHVYINCASVLLDNSSVLDTFSIIELSPLVREGIRKACFACIDWSALLAWGLDGVDVNDVIKSVNEQPEEKEAEPLNDQEDLLGPSDGGDEDNEFENLANDQKMNEDGGEEANEDGEPDISNDGVDESASAAAGAAENDPENESLFAENDNTPDTDQNAESKVVSSNPSSSDPSFF